ncbi:helix-turn-helix transcriptional regulator [Phosphitispora fastidiosa]|uniref:helix-turn-helix transcriptional regulator n=1 Tax=Phosphitispora fastidiosa TaxID=2837202 RepID=UPI001E3B1FB3|nr:WYL domain-containing transcriptional regulator [Phosphitispora fastidiosa]MBU7006171.1 putative DNA-binding transcriptional regulator YafY [Phosphitispora fastidiosa]
MSLINPEYRTGVGRNAFARIQYIHAAIKARKYPNVNRLAEQFEVSTRAVERDLEMMRDLMGAPIVYSYSQKGYYYADENFSIPKIRMTEGELAAVFLGERLLTKYQGHPYEKEIKSAYTKIQALFPESAVLDYDEIERTVTFAVEDARGDGQILLGHYQIIQGAIGSNRTVFADYYSLSSDSRSERHIDPYHLRFQDGAWYCIGFCHMRKEIRMFALDRFYELKLTERSFKRDKNFNIEEYLAYSLNLERGSEPREVTIAFDRYAARWVRERRWHESQRLDEQPDGSVILGLTVSGLNEVKRWVMSFGSHAEVLAPAELRQEIMEEIAAMLGNYS